MTSHRTIGLCSYCCMLKTQLLSKRWYTVLCTACSNGSGLNECHISNRNNYVSGFVEQHMIGWLICILYSPLLVPVMGLWICWVFYGSFIWNIYCSASHRRNGVELLLPPCFMQVEDYLSQHNAACVTPLSRDVGVNCSLKWRVFVTNCWKTARRRMIVVTRMSVGGG